MNTTGLVWTRGNNSVPKKRGEPKLPSEEKQAVYNLVDATFDARRCRSECDVVAVAIARAGRQNERQVASCPVADSSVAEQRVAVSELEVANCDDVATEPGRRRAGRHRADLRGPNGFSGIIRCGWPNYRRRKRSRCCATCAVEVQRTGAALRPGAEWIIRSIRDSDTCVEPRFGAYEWIQQRRLAKCNAD
jgi:hypothetical protein